VLGLVHVFHAHEVREDHVHRAINLGKSLIHIPLYQITVPGIHQLSEQRYVLLVIEDFLFRQILTQFTSLSGPSTLRTQIFCERPTSAA
jgi:hypothetical protein